MSWWEECRNIGRRVDLRFADRPQEREFKKSLQRRLVIASMISCLLLSLGGCLRLMGEVKAESARDDNAYDFSWEDPRTTRWFGYVVGNFLLPTFILILGIAWWKLGCCKWVDWEALMTAYMSLVLLGAPWVNGWNIAHLFNQDPDHVFSEDMRVSEGLTLLAMDAIVSGMCLLMPLRMIRKWIPAAVACVSFTVSVLVVPPPFPNVSLHYVFVLCGLCLSALGGAWQNEREFRKSWIHKSQSKRKTLELEHQQSGNSRILERLCDGVVHLDHDFRILDPNPRLVALLLCRSVESLRNSFFCDFLASKKDRDHFTSALRGAGDNGGMVPIYLRDTCGFEFLVYGYHTRMYDKEGECGHMIALVEAQERCARGEDYFAVCPSSAMSDLSELHLWSENVDKDGAQSGSSDLSESTDGSSGNMDIAAWVDIASDDLEIASCTPGFGILGHSSTERSLCNILAKDTAKFKVWLQETFNNHVNTGKTEFESFAVRVSPCGASTYEFVAQCKPDFSNRQLKRKEACLMRINREDACLMRVIFLDLRRPKKVPLTKKVPLITL